MTRLRLLVRVAPVSEPLPYNEGICSRCGIRFATNFRLTGYTQCPDCRPPTDKATQILVLDEAGWTPQEIADALDTNPRYVRLVIRSNPA